MRKKLIAPAVFVLAFALSAVLYMTSRPAGALALAEYSVSNLSCGSCVSNIQKALAEVEGVGQVDVDVTLGKARVEFSPEKVSADAIAGRISEADYPATLRRVLSSDEYLALRKEEARLADRYVGRIGEELISRDDFAAELGEGSNPGNVKAAWGNLVQRQLLLQDASRNGVVVQDGEVRVEIEQLRGKHQGFEAFVAENYGGIEAFTEAMKTNMIINRNIERNVVAGETDPLRKQQLLDAWYGRLSAETPVVIFDPELKAALAGGKGGCGGGCCG